MKNKKVSFGLILFFAIFFGFILYISLPMKIVLPENTHLSLKTLPLYSIDAAVSANAPSVECNGGVLDIHSDKKGDFEYNITLFEKIPLKKLKVSVIPKNYVIPSGEAVGVKMFTDGLLVVCVSEVVDKSGNRYYPTKDAGLRETDRILTIDNINIESNEQISDYINKVKRKVRLRVARDEEIFETDVVPVLSNDGHYRIGVWVRDSTAGIGTMTYYNPQNNTLAALGHAICDSDTGAVLKVSQGDLVGCEILSVRKGEHGAPGELSGQFQNNTLGKIIKNNDFGIYGKINNPSLLDTTKAVEVATRYQVKQGSAQILCDVDQEGVKSYDVEIVSVSKSAIPDNKGIVLKVTDEELLSKTGGIVQGMSGSAIIQNGKLVGAVTHVLVNDPTKGYGIFIENMLSEAEKIS